MSASNTFKNSAAAYRSHMLRNNYPTHASFLSNTTKTGHLSPYALKLCFQFLGWLTCVIAFGAASDFARAIKNCDGKCGFVIGASGGTWIALLILMILNYLCEAGSMKREGGFSAPRESQYLLALGVWSIFWVACNSLVDMGTTQTGVFFGWVSLFSIIASAIKSFEVANGSEEYAKQHNMKPEVTDTTIPQEAITEGEPDVLRDQDFLSPDVLADDKSESV